MSRNIFAVPQMASLLLGVGTLLQSKINREGIRCVDITGGYRKYQGSHVPVGVRIF